MVTPTFASRGVTFASTVAKAGAPVSARAPSTTVTAAKSAAAAGKAPTAARGFAAAAAEAGTVGEAASALEQQYAPALRYLHWLIAGGTIGTFACVQIAQRVKGKDKMYWMKLHKSLGLTVLALTAPRLLLRLTTKIPAPVPGSSLEQAAAAAGHAAMYGFLVFMPTTGFIMGYYGGRGLPFFGYTIPGAAEKNTKLAGQAFGLHKQVGQAYELFVPLHVGAVGFHALKGQNIMRRMGVTVFG